MVNDKVLREQLELISSICSMLEDVKKNDRINNTLFKLFNNLSLSLSLYQHMIINLNDEIEQQNKRDGIALRKNEIEKDEIKKSIENIKNFLKDSHNSEANAVLESTLKLNIYAQKQLQESSELIKFNSEVIKNSLIEYQYFIIEHFLKKIKSRKSLFPFLSGIGFDITFNLLGGVVANLKSIFDILIKVVDYFRNSKIEDLLKNSDFMGVLEDLISSLVVFSYGIITISSNSGSTIRKAEWIQLKREALPVVKMYIENYIPQEHNDDMKKLIDEMKKFIRES